MEISLLKALLNNICSFFHISSCDSLNSEPVCKYYQKAEEILKLLKPILDAIIDSDAAYDELLNKAFEGLGQSVDELRELFESCDPLMSKVYFVLQIESLISKCRTSGLEIFQLLKSYHECLPAELSSASLEPCIQKIKHMGYEPTSTVMKEALQNQAKGAGCSPETLTKIADGLSLRSNKELLIEIVALEKLKENAEQAEKNVEFEYFDQMIALVMQMHDRLIMMKQSQSCSPVPIPGDFCCPLSLELMTDPVILGSGQTYERAFIEEWIDLGLTVCPKTRQNLARTNLIPNYTVKALIANWCESNNVILPDPMKAMNLNHHSPLLAPTESGLPRESAMLPHSRVNRSLSPEIVRSEGSPGKNLISSSSIHRGPTSPSHPRSSSEGSLSVAGNGRGLDIGRISLVSYEDKLANSEEGSIDSDGQLSTSPSRKAFSSGVADTSFQGSHKRASSASTPGDANGVLQVPPYPTSNNSNASEEVTPGSQAAANLTTPQREAEFPPRLEPRSRSQTIWRRPSERFLPRIISPPSTEVQADLSGIESEVRKLVEDLKSVSLETQREATASLRLLAKHNMDNRIVIAHCGAIGLLVNLLCSTDTTTQENAVTALLNLSINDNNKLAIANAEAIEPLIHVLKTGSSEAKENSAATLFSLSVIEDNKVRIGRSGAIGPLVDLLGNGTPRGKKDAATALFNLSIFHENKAHIVHAGAVKYLVELMDPAAGMVDKAVAVLANLSTIPEGRVAIGQAGGVTVLVEVVELGSARGKENAAAALLQLCTNSPRFCSMVLQEGAVPPLVALSQSGTPRAKEKAQQLLSYFRNQRHGNAGRG